MSHFTATCRWFVAVSALCAAVLALHEPPRASAQTPGQTAPFSQIVASDPADYAGYRIKLTYTGPQTKTTPTLLLHGPAAAPDVADFLPFRSPAVHYGNDEARVQALEVSAGSIERFVRGLTERPELQTRGTPAEVLSLMIARPATPSPVVFEHLADELDADQVLNVAEAAIRAEPVGTRNLFIRFRNFTIGPH